MIVVHDLTGLGIESVNLQATCHSSYNHGSND